LIPDGCVLLLTGSRHLARPWGCGRLSHVRPRLVIHGGARGADRLAGGFFGKVAPVEVVEADWSTGKGAGIERNGVMLERAQERARDLGVALHAIALWDGASTGTANMLSRLKRAGVPVLVLRQLPPEVSGWSDDLREEVDEVAGRWLADRVEAGKAATKEQIAKADLHAEGVVRAAFAWRKVSPAS
jgi:hypothetical protein